MRGAFAVSGIGLKCVLSQQFNFVLFKFLYMLPGLLAHSNQLKAVRIANLANWYIAAF